MIAYGSLSSQGRSNGKVPGTNSDWAQAQKRILLSGLYLFVVLNKLFYM